MVSLLRFATPSERNITRVYELVEYANEVTSYWFGNLIIIAVFCIFFFSLSQNFGSKRAFMASSWITALVAIILGVFGLVNQVFIFVPILCAGLGVVLMMIE